MKKEINQGDILKIEKISMPVLVVSKNFFNQEGEIIGCPIYKDCRPGALHIRVETEEASGYVQCEKMKLLDMRIRGYSKLDRVHMSAIIDITDAIQGIFDYV